MANVETKDGHWYDLGQFKQIQCSKINKKEICKITFTEGNLTISKQQLKKILNSRSLLPHTSDTLKPP